MTIIPSVIENENGVEKVYDVYSRLLKDRIIFIGDEITDDVANGVISQLLFLDSLSNDEINIYINSPGGSITAGLAIYDTMNYIKSPISTTCIGIAASMASILLSAGDKRYILPNGEVMIHQPLGGVSGQATEIKIVADRIVYLRKKLNKILANNTKQPLKKIEHDTERDYYLSADEALRYGIVDKILKKET